MKKSFLLKPLSILYFFTLNAKVRFTHPFIVSLICEISKQKVVRDAEAGRSSQLRQILTSFQQVVHWVWKFVYSSASDSLLAVKCEWKNGMFPGYPTFAVDKTNRHCILNTATWRSFSVLFVQHLIPYCKWQVEEYCSSIVFLKNCSLATYCWRNVL